MPLCWLCVRVTDGREQLEKGLGKHIHGVYQTKSRVLYALNMTVWVDRMRLPSPFLTFAVNSCRLGGNLLAPGGLVAEHRVTDAHWMEAMTGSQGVVPHIIVN